MPLTCEHRNNRGDPKLKAAQKSSKSLRKAHKTSIQGPDIDAERLTRVVHNAGQGFGCDGEGMQSEHGGNGMEDKVQRAARKGRESEGKAKGRASFFPLPTRPARGGLPAPAEGQVGILAPLGRYIGEWTVSTIINVNNNGTKEPARGYHICGSYPSSIDT